MQLLRQNYSLTSNPVCLKSVDNLNKEDFLYFDKDGFELNRAEQKFYSAMGYPLNYPCLNHICWQVPWFEMEDNTLFLDHSIVLHRCDYSGSAYDQIREMSEKIPQAKLLLQAKQKWGFDFDLNAVSPSGDVYEVLHIEYDSTDYEKFKTNLIHTEYLIRHTDWHEAARKVWDNRSEWQNLKGFDQNHWKANFLIGWNKSETLEKVI